MRKDQEGNLVMTKGMKILHIVAAIVLIGTIATLGTFLGLYVRKDGKWRSQTENIYRSSYYTLTDSLLNMENNLAKMRVARTDSMQQQLLIQTALNARTAQACLSALSEDGHDLTPLMKFANQTGDYAQYCAHKISMGDSIDDMEYRVLDQMYELAYRLNVSLGQIGAQADENGQNFVADVGKVGQILTDALGDLADGGIEYPSLIYDGPFSDALEKREPIALKGQEYDAEEAKQFVERALGGKKMQSCELLSECSSGFDSYLYAFTAEDGAQGSAEITKIGGIVVMWDSSVTVDDPTYSEEEGVQLAAQYLKACGMEHMSAVWSSVRGSVLYVNFCYQTGDVICYPDMVKVKVSLQTGEVVGYEALNYIYNHNEKRDFVRPALTPQQAQTTDCGSMEVSGVRLALIPTAGGGERLTYELSGTLENTMFFVYVDADTGRQVKILQVIDSDEGKLLM